MRILWLLASALLLGAAEPTKPNIVFVLIDDMGWGDFSCFGNTEAKTPNIDRLAAEGLRFKQFYVNSPICSPSRCAFVTGQYPQRWRINSYLEFRAANEAKGNAQWLDPRAPSLARTLQAGGYATGHFGKWHLGGQRDVDDAPAITAYGYDASLTNFEGMGPKLLPLTRKPGDKEPKKIWADAERLGGPAGARSLVECAIGESHREGRQRPRSGCRQDGCRDRGGVDATGEHASHRYIRQRMFGDDAREKICPILDGLSI